MNTATNQFFVHNTTHDRHNRRQRLNNPQHGTRTHLPAGMRVLRARPVQLTRQQLEQHLPQYLGLVDAGAIEVRTPDGGLVDLKTFTAVAPIPHQPPPKELVDTLATDTPAGIPMPQFIEGIPLDTRDASDAMDQDDPLDLETMPELPAGPLAPMGGGIPDALDARPARDEDLRPYQQGKKSKKGRR